MGVTQEPAFELAYILSVIWYNCRAGLKNIILSSQRYWRNIFAIHPMASTIIRIVLKKVLRISSLIVVWRHGAREQFVSRFVTQGDTRRRVAHLRYLEQSK